MPGVSDQLLHDHPVLPADIHDEGGLPEQGVGGAGKAGVIGPECHLHHVQEALIHLPVVY